MNHPAMVAALRLLAEEAPLIDPEERQRLLDAWRARPGLRDLAATCVRGHDRLAPGALYANGTCVMCARARAAAQRAKRRTLAECDPRHGTTNGYHNFGCRCEPCRQAAKVENRAQYLRRKAAA